MCAIFTVTVDETSAVALRSCLSLAVKDSHRAGSLLPAACEPAQVHECSADIEFTISKTQAGITK